jgi:tripartite-type tricarboxylate transporter receptor subunit TctC
MRLHAIRPRGRRGITAGFQATRRRAFALAALVCMSAAGAAHGQGAGQDVMRLVVPFAAGSYTDNVARLVAPVLADQLHRNVIVENRAGANGIIGAEYVARAKPDGLTLLVGGASVNTINPSIYKSLPYDPVSDLLPVARIGVLPFLLLVNPELPVKTVPELIAYAKAHPGKLSYATPNAATLVGMETFKRAAGIDILSVPYKSSPQAMTDLAGNVVQVLIADYATGMPQVRSGKARLIAVTMAQRSALLPDVPPVSDTIKGFDLSAWTGLLGPGKLAPEKAQEIYAALEKGLKSDSALQERLRSIGFDVQPMGPQTFGPYIRSEIDSWHRLTRDAGVEPQ